MMWGMHKHEVVGTLDLESSLKRLEVGRSGGVEGLFGPESISWRINRHTALFAGAWRAALLQLAHPWVAQALKDFSPLTSDPVGRFHRTFRVVFTMVFGSTDQALGMARALHSLHSGIRGTVKLSDDSAAKPYAANQRGALIWVMATLWDTAVKCHEHLVHPLTPEEREQYYVEGRRFAALFGITPEELPPDWVAFQAYMATMIASGEVHVTPTARELGQFLFAAPQVPLRGMWSGVARSLTAEWMPAPLRVDFGLPCVSAAEWTRYCRIMARIRRTYALLPPRLRYVPPYFEALRRLRGADQPDVLTRLGNRIWIGQPSLVTR